MVLFFNAKKLAMLIPQIRSFIFTLQSQFIILYTVTQVKAITVCSYLFLFAAIMNQQSNRSGSMTSCTKKNNEICGPN
jgi:hypothetical protein